MKIKTLFISLILLTGLAFGQGQFSGGGGGGGGLPAGLTYSNPTLTVSTAGSGNGSVALSGNTSGTCTMTTDATSTTVTSSCFWGVPNGTSTKGGLVFPSLGSAWFYGATTSGSVIFTSGAGNDSFLMAPGGQGVAVDNGGVYGFSNTGNMGGALSQIDGSFSRNAAGVIIVNSTAVGNGQGKLKASGYMSVGTTFAASGCANSTLVGGGSAGKYTSVTGGSCTVTITMGDSATAPTGWICDAHDLTTVADANNVTMGTSTTTTANLVEGTVAANDVIAFKCTGY